MTEAVYPSSIKLEIWAIYPWNYYPPKPPQWVDISAYLMVEGNQDCRWGMPDNQPLTLLASTGTMSFTLDNRTQKFSPETSTAFTGFGKGAFIRFSILYAGQTYIRFLGKIDRLEIMGNTNSERRTFVTAVDWLNHAATYPLDMPTLEADKTADEALTTIIAGMPVAPTTTSYDVGLNTFPALFDSVSLRTRAYTEMSKIVNSEYGLIYLRHDPETLVMENYHRRHGWITPTYYERLYNLTTETGAWLTAEDGSPLLAEGTALFMSDNSMSAVEVSYGDQVANQVIVTAYPKRIDLIGGGVKTLYKLDTPMRIGRGETKTFRASYTDPDGGGARVNALDTSMVAPAATTHYLFNTAADGTGTNITANLTVTAVYSTAGIEYTLVSTSSLIGYVTFLEAKGLGIYRYDSIEDVQNDTESQDLNGVIPLNLDMPLQRDLSFGLRVGERLLDENKGAHTTLESVTFWANKSDTLMQAFLNLDVGDMVNITEDQTGVSGNFYIQGVRFTVYPGKLISFTWIVTQSLSLIAGLTMVGVEFRGAATQDCINFGYQPTVSNLTNKSYSVWVYVDPATTELYAYSVMGNYTGVDDEGGSFLGIRQVDRKIFWIQDGVTAGSRGEWDSSVISAADLFSKWNHIVVTRDADPVTNQPVIYLNGVSLAVTQITAQAGANADETGNPFTIGNYYYGGGASGYIAPFNGVIEDARVYGTVLTQAQVTTLYNEGPGGTSVLGYLFFQGPTVRASEIRDYIDKTLLSTDKMIDNAYNARGSIIGAPVARVPLRVSVIGDSIAANSGMWPDELPVTYASGAYLDITNHAESGASVILNMAEQVLAAAEDNADIIIMALGSNDGDGGNMTTLQGVVEQAITDLGTSNPNATIYYMNVLPRWTDVSGTTEVAKGNIRTAIAAACTAKGVTCWDTYTTPWIAAANTADGVHPNAAGVALIVAEIIALL